MGEAAIAALSRLDCVASPSSAVSGEDCDADSLGIGRSDMFEGWGDALFPRLSLQMKVKLSGIVIR